MTAGKDTTSMDSFAAVFGSPPVPPPVPIDWAAVEGWLGLTLPSDYKTIASGYGPLDIGEFVWMHVPCVQAERFDYGKWLASTHRSCRISSREVPPHTPPSFHPEPGGLLAWGMTRGADQLFWDTTATTQPDTWPVVIYHQDAVNRGDDPWLHYATPLAETLVEATGAGLLLPGGGRTHPLPPAARPTAFLTAPRPWNPPPAPAAPDPRRLAAVTEGSGLAALTSLVAPPDAPHPGGGWEDLFQELGTRLPAEYVALMNRYGAGCWREWLRFRTPSRATFVPQVREILAGYRELRDEFPEDYPLAVWPEPGGFLPFADSIDGDDLGWLTGGDPDSWPLIVHPRHDDQGPPLPGTLIDTLLEWSRGRLAAPGLPPLDADDDPLDFARFEPWSDEP